MPAIEARELTKYFPRSGRLGWRAVFSGLAPEERFTALDAVTADVPEGEVLGILGRNGAGKSTLLRVVAGIYAADRGAVVLRGDVGGLFELGGLGNTQLTGRQFTRRYLELFGVGPRDWPRLIADVHEFSELGEYFDEKIHTYSTGMGARLYFSAATAVPHRIYLIDEVLSVGDEHFQTKSWARMRARLAGGASGLLVTHDWAAVIKLCRNSKVLQSGRVAIDGPSDEVVASYLDLQPAAADQARFDLPPATWYEAESGSNATLSFPVELVRDGAVEAILSIEALHLGIGWEPVVFTEYRPVADKRGSYRVDFHFDPLPIAPGEYTLNVFLATPPDASTGARTALDTRGWTYGNSLRLRVHGRATGGIAPFPVRWSQEPR